jgi:ribosomal-protein-serine acetyltransferase
VERLPERVETPRLILRRWTVDNAELLSAAVEANLQHLRPWMDWAANEPLSNRDRIALLEEWDRSWGAGEM